MPSTRQIEAKLNQCKRPVNPDGGATAPLEFTGPPRRHVGGADPTIAYYDGEGTGSIGGGTGTGTPKINIAPIDYVRDRDTFAPTPPGGTAPNTGQPYP
jgi:hypothetical protein